MNNKYINKLRLLEYNNIADQLKHIDSLIGLDIDDFCEKSLVSNIEFVNKHDIDDRLVYLLYAYLLETENNIDMIILKINILFYEIIGRSIIRDDFIFTTLLLRDTNYSLVDTIKDLIDINSFRRSLSTKTLGIKRMLDKGYYGIQIKGLSMYIHTGEVVDIDYTKAKLRLDIREDYSIELYDLTNENIRYELKIDSKIKDIIAEYDRIFNSILYTKSKKWMHYVLFGEHKIKDSEFKQWISELETK